MPVDPDALLVTRKVAAWPRTIAVAAGAYAFIGGLLSLAGWVFSINRLIDWDNNGITMKTNTTVAMIAAGVSLLLITFFHAAGAARRIAAVLGMFVALIGGLTLWQHLAGWNLGIDTFLFDESAGMRATVSPNRMGPPAALSFLLLGIALILVSTGSGEDEYEEERKGGGRRGRRHRPAVAVALGVIVLMVTSVSLIGYLYGAQQTSTLRLTGIAIQAASMLFGLAVGIIVSVREREPMRSLLDEGSAGVLARWSLPIIVVVSVGLGAVRVWIQQKGWVDTALGTSMRSIVEMAILCAFLWWAARVIRAREGALLKSQREVSAGAEKVIAMLESITDGFIQMDSEWRFVYVNAAAERINGMSRHDLFGRSHWEVFPAAIGTAVDREYRRAVAEKVSVEFENYYEPWRRWFSIQANPTPDGGLAVFYHDVTEAKRIDEVLRTSEARLRVFADAAPAMLWETDRDGSCTFLSREWYGLTGQSEEEAMGIGWTTATHPDHEANAAHVFLDANRRRVEFRLEYLLRRRDGEYRWALDVGRPQFSPTGEYLGMVGAVIDIHERKSAEEALRHSELRFRTAIGTVTDLVWTNDASGQMFGEQPGWSSFTGQSKEEYQGHGWARAVHPDDAQPTLEAWRRAVDSKGTFVFEHRVRRHDGEWRHFAVKAEPVMEPDGTIREWVGVHTDITERKSMEVARAVLLEKERQARAEAERNGRIKDEFLATLSHELRTPMTAILGWGALLRKDIEAFPEVARQGFEVIDRNARLQAKIIEDLLDMSRIISGKLRMNVVAMNVGTAIAGAVESVRPAADAKDIRLQTVCDPNTGNINGDPDRLQQVFYNLLTNAVKFTPKGGRVQVVCQRVNAHLEVSVSDTGEGIAAEFVPYVFERFRQQNAATTRKHGGLGLGLAIVKQLVELHGGKVAAASEGEGKGATFTVHLPVSVVTTMPNGPLREPPEISQPSIADLPAEDRGELAPSNREQGDHPSLAGVRIVVVDDEPDARFMLKQLLENEGAEVTIAGGAREALGVLERHRPQVLLCDIGMPEMDGHELIRAVRGLGAAKGGATPAIALTAFARPEDRTKSLRSGFQMHLSKPIEPAELFASIQSLVGQRDHTPNARVMSERE